MLQNCLKLEDCNVKTANILVIDDEPANIKLVENVFKKAGYENIFSVQDPREAMAAFEQHTPDLILLDLNMPYLDGFDIMELLKNSGTADLPPILVLTAQAQQEYCEKALDQGASDFVSKPYSIKELLSRVNNLLQVSLFHKYMKRQHELLEKEVQERTQALQDAHEKLQKSHLQIVQKLGQAAEYRDNETGLHIIRMSKISAVLGKAAGMSDEEADMLLNASPMHDIGKIGIPDDILLKPGKLTAEEWKIMKTHTEIGANMLHDDESELLTMAKEIAMTHHEKWDGSGYPYGLKAEEIPLVGRICSLADVFDALTSERPYKKPWPVEEALDYIAQESGKQFDPALVELFNKVLPEVIEIKEAYAEPAHLVASKEEIAAA